MLLRIYHIDMIAQICYGYFDNRDSTVAYGMFKWTLNRRKQNVSIGQ